MVRIVQTFGVPGDGYGTGVSPHTKYETYVGLSFQMAYELVRRKKLDHKVLTLLRKIAAKAKQLVSERFKLTKKLYYNYTHLVCRSALIELGTHI